MDFIDTGTTMHTYAWIYATMAQRVNINLYSMVLVGLLKSDAAVGRSGVSFQ